VSTQLQLNILVYHIISYHITSYTTPYHITSHHIVYHIISYIISYHIIPYHIINKYSVQCGHVQIPDLPNMCTYASDHLCSNRISKGLSVLYLLLFLKPSRELTREIHIILAGWGLTRVT